MGETAECLYADCGLWYWCRRRGIRARTDAVVCCYQRAVQCGNNAEILGNYVPSPISPSLLLCAVRVRYYFAANILVVLSRCRTWLELPSGWCCYGVANFLVSGTEKGCATTRQTS
eukprot:3440941-Rhodomonas_salina.1